MEKYSTKQFGTSRLIFQTSGTNSGGIEAQTGGQKDTFNDVANTVKESYEKQLLLMRKIKETLKPIEGEVDKHWEVIKEMFSALNNGAQAPLERDLEVMGEQVHIVMDGKGEYQEYLNGQGINFYNWALQKKQSN